MAFRHWLLHLGFATCVGLGAGCSVEDSTDDDPDDSEPIDATLTMGTLLSVSGNLEFLGPAQVAGARLALEDINAGGGVFDKPVVLHEGDSGDSGQRANAEGQRLLDLGVNAIIGATSSGVSLTVIDRIIDAGVILFSPANTSPVFTTYPDNGLYFRTSPSDTLQGRALAELIARDGDDSIAILYLNDPYGDGLADTISGVFVAGGGTVALSLSHDYPPSDLDAQIEATVAADPDAIVVIGFDESVPLLEALHEAGIGPTSSKNLWGVDGNMGNSLAHAVSDPTLLTGMRGTLASADLSAFPEFTARFSDAYGAPVDDFSYGPETYDAVVITALAAEIAQSGTSIDIAAEINDVTRGGTPCTSFAACKALIADGEDIDYDGYGGPYEFVDAGEPSRATFAVLAFDGSTSITVQEYYLTD